jgi:hypothetical protein
MVSFRKRVIDWGAARVVPLYAHSEVIMTEREFCYWLQGLFELKKTIDHRDGASAETMKMIEDHLALVFKKVTPNTVGKIEETPQRKSYFDYGDWIKKINEKPLYPHIDRLLDKNKNNISTIQC